MNAYPSIKSYRDLLTWQKAMDLAKGVYRLTRKLPKEETYGLVSQMRRAAVSVPSNIAEGHARNTPGEFAQFLGQARGSLAELETQLLLAGELFLAADAELELTLAQAEEVSRMLNGLRLSVEKKVRTKR